MDPPGKSWIHHWQRKYWCVSIFNTIFSKFSKKKNLHGTQSSIANKIDYKYVDLLLSQKTESASDKIPIKDTESKTYGKEIILRHK